jgi:uncharacterized protein with HEPN domain
VRDDGVRFWDVIETDLPALKKLVQEILATP